MKATKEQTKMLDRLKKRSDFLRAQNAGQKWVSPSLILQILPHPAESPPAKPRIGFTVTKRVSKRATDRNRIKRRLRALACDVLPLYARADADYVLIGRLETATRSYDDLARDLRWCLRKTGFGKDGA